MSARPELDLALTNMNALASLAADLLVAILDQRPPNDGAYAVSVEVGDQLAALLVAARDYGRARLAAHDGMVA